MGTPLVTDTASITATYGRGFMTEKIWPVHHIFMKSLSLVCGGRQWAMRLSVTSMDTPTKKPGSKPYSWAVASLPLTPQARSSNHHFLNTYILLGTSLLTTHEKLSRVSSLGFKMGERERQWSTQPACVMGRVTVTKCWSQKKMGLTSSELWESRQLLSFVS
jgi:hypothetical protein